MREAEVDPAESTVLVVLDASVISLVPSSASATWRITPTSPWPTSTPAQCTVALPSTWICTRAAQ